jgi:hypothetical protein
MAGARTALVTMVTLVARCFALGKGDADTAQTQETAKGRGGDGFEGVAARGRGRQGFGQLVKAGRVHFLPSFLEAALPPCVDKK